MTPAPESSRAAEIRQGKRRAEEVNEQDQGRRSQAPRLSERSTLRLTPSGEERVSTTARSAVPVPSTPNTQNIVETIEINEDDGRR